MGLKPSFSKDTASPVDKYVGTAYDDMKLIADNMELLKQIEVHIPVLMQYLGAYTEAPTERPDGTPLQNGDYYFDTVKNALTYFDLNEGIWFVVDPGEILNARDEALAAQRAAEEAEARAKEAADTAETKVDEATATAIAAAELAESNAKASELAAKDSENKAKASEDAAALSEDEADSSANSSAISASSSASSALAASKSEANASTSETNAAISEANALIYKNNAEASALQAATAFDNFDDRFLGTFTTPPTTDNDGDPLVPGTTYWHDNGDGTGQIEYYNGVEWEAPSITATQAAASASESMVLATERANESIASAAVAVDSASQAQTSRLEALDSEAKAAASELAAELARDIALQAEANAKTSETNASTSEANAAASEMIALSAADEAEDFAEVALGHSVTSEIFADKSEASAQRAEALESAIAWKHYVRSQAQMEQMIQQNTDEMVSGFVHYGKHWNGGGIVNEGISMSATDANIIYIGRTSNTAVGGTSKTGFAVTHIAGFVSEILGMNSDSPSVPAAIKFPEAPNGTVIYDSTGDARGSGKAQLDLSKEVDPKYGDVAADTNEAVARAFEGLVKNGDFRFGDNGDWQISTTDAWQEISVTPNTPLTFSASAQAGNLSIYNGSSFAGGDRLVLVTQGDTETHTVTPTQSTVRVLALNGGNTFTSSVEIKPVTEEVVTERVDVFGGEFFLEAVTEEKPFIYPKGMIQSQATEMNGITTERSNRPETYYAVFDGDETSTGLGVDFFALTDAQKQAVLADASNNLFLMDDGTLVQWRMRQRTIAGAGNGDWDNIDCNFDGGTSYQTLRYKNLSRVQAQGALDYFDTWGDNNSLNQYRATYNQYALHNEIGVFGLDDRYTENFAVNGLCFMHIWGSVPRLNSGAYHPSLNSAGASLFEADTNTYARPWYSSDITYAITPSKCFTHVAINTGTSEPNSGSIASGLSGHPDNRFHDSIYSSGLGGVRDERLPAHDMSSAEEAAKYDAKVKNGTARGVEQLVKTRFHDKAYTGFFSATNDSHASIFTEANGGGSLLASWDNGLPMGTQVVIYQPSTGLICYGRSSNANGHFQVTTVPRNRVSTSHDLGIVAKFGTSSRVYIAEVSDINITVEGNASQGFTVQDVIGDPANIIQTPQLSQGWYGYWSNQIPNGVIDNFAATRKALDNPSFLRTPDNGDSWDTANPAWNSTTNSAGLTNEPSGNVLVMTYTAAPYVTTPDENRPVFNGEAGLGSVWAGSWNDTYQSIFAESLMHKVITNGAGSANGNVENNLPLTNFALANLKELVVGNYFPLTHEPLTLGTPNNNSPAVKALRYQSAESQGLHLSYAWNELAWTAPTYTQFSSSSSQLFEAGKVYLCTSGKFAGRMFIGTNGSNTIVLDSYYFGNDGLMYPSNGSVRGLLQMYNGLSDSWGDDSTVVITNSGTYTNLNGETLLAGSNRTSKRYGYAVNKAGK